MRVVDTGEELTVTRDAGRLEVAAGLDEADVDYAVEITAAHAARLAFEARQVGPLSEVEKYRVVAALFTAATRATLRRPRLASPILRRISGAESLIHVCLASPEPAAEGHTCHTLVHAAGQWLVVEGLHGRPQRSFRMSVDQTLDYQRRVVRLMRNESLPAWIGFARWYRSWRPTVSRRGPMTDLPQEPGEMAGVRGAAA